MKNVLLTLLALVLLAGFALAVPSGDISDSAMEMYEMAATTMELKRIKNLRIAGEVIDCDALTGGFNLQIAWSTAFMAAQ